MSADVCLHPLTERGEQIINELEAKTETYPYRSSSDGSRCYWLSAEDVGVDGFDAALDRIAPDWREHLSRTQ